MFAVADGQDGVDARGEALREDLVPLAAKRLFTGNVARSMSKSPVKLCFASRRSRRCRPGIGFCWPRELSGSYSSGSTQVREPWPGPGVGGIGVGSGVLDGCGVGVERSSGVGGVPPAGSVGSKMRSVGVGTGVGGITRSHLSPTAV
ncbi:MAG: hypothetical protein U0470_06410 [Anaerolineae bacterium]